MVGDLVQTFDVTMPVDERRGSYIGRVVAVETNPEEGVEYVLVETSARLFGGIAEPRRPEEVRIRAPQNGTPASNGRVCDGIRVIER